MFAPLPLFLIPSSVSTSEPLVEAEFLEVEDKNLFQRQ